MNESLYVKRDRGGGVFHSLDTFRRALSCVNDRCLVFLLMVVGDFLVFFIIVAMMVYVHVEKKKRSVRIGLHRYFRRDVEKKEGKKIGRPRTATFFIYLALHSHVGVLGRSVLDNDVDFEGEMGSFDGHSLMARTSSSWRPPAVPTLPVGSPRRRTSDDFDRSDDSNAERYYQMAFVFPLNGDPTSARLPWDDYWDLHRYVAGICGSSIDNLLAIHGVQHLPEDLEDIEVQAVLPQLAGDARHGDGQVFTLVDVEFHGGAYVNPVITERRSRLIPKQITRQGFLQYINMAKRCEESQGRCIAWINNVVWREQDGRIKNLQHGDYLRCAVPPKRQECTSEITEDETVEMDTSLDEDPEGISLVQTRADIVSGTPTPSSIPTRSIFVYLLGRDVIDLEVTEITFSDITESLASNWHIERGSVAGLHEVQDPPLTLQTPGNRVFILERLQDTNFRLASSDVLAMVDVVLFQGTGLNRISNRLVTWIRCRQLRLQLLAFLRVDRICDQEGTECVVMVNNAVWGSHDNTMRHFIFGDFVKVEIFVSQGTVEDALTQLRVVETCDRHRRLYTSSPSSEGRGRDLPSRSPSFQGRESRSRSRSRGNGEAPGNAEEAPWVLTAPIDDYGSIHSPNWLGAVSVFDRLPPPGNPSNEELSVEPAVDNVHSEWISSADEAGPRNDTAEVFQIDDDGNEVYETSADPSINFQLSMPMNLEAIVALMQPWTNSPLRIDIPASMPLSPISLQFVARCNAGWNSGIGSIHIYTDGSSSKSRDVSGFAFAVFGFSKSGASDLHSFLGWTGGQNTVNCDLANFIGVTDHSSSSSETSALTWAHIWLLQSGIQLPVTFHFDARVVGMGATGEWNFDPGNTALRKLREVVQLTAQLRIGAQTAYEHVKAHSSHPCNDFADGCAKMCAAGGMASSSLPPSWQPLFKDDNHVLSWAWWWVRSLRGDPCLPPLKDGAQRWHMDGEVSTEKVASVEDSKAVTKEASTLRIRMATLNVLTLRNKKTDDGHQGEDLKAALLRKQFGAAGVHVVALQETRATQDCTICTEDYIRFVSAGDGGYHGCEIWVSKVLPFIEKDRGSTFSIHEATVIDNSPRSIIVKCRISGCMVLFASLHAPIENAKQEEKDQWWHRVSQKLGGVMPGTFTFIMGDFNSRLGDDDGLHVGDRTCAATNDNGMRLYYMMQDLNLWAPSTFSSVHAGPDFTWTHPREIKSRLDYILVSQDDSLLPWSSRVMPEIQSSLTVRDHEAVQLDVDLYTQKRGRNTKRRNYDWEALQTPWGASKIKEIINNLPDPQWSDDVHIHWQRLEEGIHQGLEKFFPAKAKKHRKDIFTQETWNQLRSRKWFKEALDHCDDVFDAFEQRSVILAWRDGAGLLAADGVVKLHQWATVLAHLFFKVGFKHHALALRKSVQQDKARFIEDVVKSANRAGTNEIFAALRPLRVGGRSAKQGLPPLPGFRPHAEDATDPVKSDQIWLSHCATLEAGVSTSTNRLLQRARKRCIERCPTSIQVDLVEMPTLVTLEGAFRHVKPRKSGGVDDLRSDICRAAAPELAAKFFPLLAKVYVQATEPVQMKGGTLIPMFKGGQAWNPADHRSLLLSSHIGNALRRSIRVQLTSAFVQTAPQTHFSIRPGGCVSHASHSLRLFVQASAKKNESVGVLYLDIRSAYYRIVRQLAVGGISEADQIHRVLTYFNLGQTSYQDIMEEISQEPSSRSSGMQPHHERLLQELLSSTWFTSRRRDALVESLAGTRPGDGLADLTFGYVFKRIMARAVGRIKEQLGIEDVSYEPRYDLTKQPPDGRPLPRLIEVVWADDLAIAYRARDARVLVQHLRAIVTIIFQENIRHALIPNMKAGKTEAQLILKGTNSKVMKAEIYNNDSPSLEIEDVPDDFSRLRIVATYRHLGTRVDVSVRHRADMKARLGQAVTTYRKYRKAIFQNRLLDQTKRVFLFRSLVMSVLSYNIGTWGKLLASELSYFRTKLYGMYRGILRCEIPELDLRLWNNDRILARLGLPSVEVLLSSARLRYSTTLYSSAPDAVWHLLAAEGDWLEQLRQDYDWFLYQLAGYGPGPSGNPWSPDIHQWCMENLKSFKPWIGRAVMHDTLQHKKEVDWREWHFNFLDQSIKVGLRMDMPQPAQEDVGGSGFEACLSCRRVFKRKAAWALHAFRCHDRRNKTREVIDGSRCHSCGKEYFTTTRLQRHLHNSEECYRHFVQAGRRRFDVLPGINNTQEQKDRRLQVPAMRSLGPRERQFSERPWPADPEFDFGFFESLMDYYEGEDPQTSVEDLVEGVRQCCMQSVLAFSEIKQTLAYFADLVEDDDLGEQCRMPPIKVSQSARISWRRFAPSWFFAPEELKAEATDDCVRNSAWEHCRTAVQVPGWAQVDYVPRVRCSTLTFLHLYSGHRRQGDLHEALSALRAPDGYVISIISVDIIYDSRAGDLAREDNQRIWLTYIKSGIIAGVFAGPPCETWSRARLHGGVPGISYGDGGPRVLRDACNPQGLGQMKVRELEQIVVANRLLCFALLVMLEVIAQNLFMILEHPAEPTAEGEQWLASIWKLFATKAFMNNGNIQRILLYQGHYGSKSPKPTCLLACVGHELCAQSILWGCRTQDHLPKQLVMGWDDESREYATASLKSYPPDLCSALSHLAQCWLDRYAHKFVDPVPLPDAFARFTEELNRAFNLLVDRGADYHRSATAT